MKEKYGISHKEAKAEKIQKMTTPRCEMTNSKMNLQAHHVVPKLFNGPDLSQNYQILSKAFHEYIHAICNVPNNSLVQRRINLARMLERNLMNPEKAPQLEQDLDDIDDVLIKNYVENMINNISGEYKDAMTSLTIQNNFHTIKKQAIIIKKQELMLEHFRKLLQANAIEVDSRYLTEDA